ncbi:MAG TPA: hypothetical protein VHI13_21600 [Candidatus Kapabacteria bacterium]|nr:hypothetical protein [Candidatus Kapabacteria bacterium]
MKTLNSSALRLHDVGENVHVDGRNMQYEQCEILANGHLLLSPEEEANKALASFADIERRAADLNELLDGLRWQRDAAVAARNEAQFRLDNAISACESFDCSWGLDSMTSGCVAAANQGAYVPAGGGDERNSSLWDHRTLRLADATLARWEADMQEQRIARLVARIAKAEAEMDIVRAEMNERVGLLQGLEHGYPAQLRAFGNA